MLLVFSSEEHSSNSTVASSMLDEPSTLSHWYSFHSSFQCCPVDVVVDVGISQSMFFGPVGHCMRVYFGIDGGYVES